MAKVGLINGAFLTNGILYQGKKYLAAISKTIIFPLFPPTINTNVR